MEFSDVDPVRPRLHVMPPSGWLNDPNGACRIDGRYHLFYQHNPVAPIHENIHWGHASSTDLLHWRNEGIALAPIPDSISSVGCWSGCVIDDDGVPTAVYTAVSEHAGNAGVGIARSDRTLNVWTQDPLVKATNPNDPAITEVRDPFVFTYQHHRYAVQGAGHPHGDPQLLLYGCDDLDQWTFLGPLLTIDDPVAAHTVPANIWECPNFFPLDNRWVVLVARWQHINGSHALIDVRYLVGDLVADGPGLRFVAESGGTVDSGPVLYAPHVLVEPDRVLMWAWVREGDRRTPEETVAAGWAGALSFPRELSLSPAGLVSRPAAEVTGLRIEELPSAPDSRIEAVSFEIITDGPTELVLIDPDRGTREIASTTDSAARILVDGSIVETFTAADAVTTRHYPTTGSHWQLMTTSDAKVWRLG